MSVLRELMVLESIWTIWFWIAHAVAWSMASHFAMGVPWDMVLQANREKDEDGPWSRAADGMIRAQVFRFTEIGQRFGTGLVGVTAFVLAAAGTLAVQAELEFARAALTFLVPLTAIYALSFRTATRMKVQALAGRPLRDEVRKQRFWNQFIGVLAIAGAAATGVWQFLSNLTPL